MKYFFFVFIFIFLTEKSFAKELNPDDLIFKEELVYSYIEPDIPLTGNVLTRNKDNKITHIQIYEMGVLTSDQKYDENSNIISIESYSDGKKHGKWEKYKKGILIRKENYEFGVRQGEGKIFYPTGKLKMVFNFTNGEINGDSISYYENGNISGKTPFKSGSIDGYNYSYYDNNQLRRKTYLKNNEVIDQTVDIFNYDGKVVSQIIYKNGKRNGLFISYDDDGTLKFKQNLIDDKKNGITIHYHKNGQVFSETNYVDDKEEGIETGYYENGNLWSRKTYVNGEEKGPVEEYYENGQLSANLSFYWYSSEKSRSFYKGKNIYYHRNGNISQILDLDDDGNGTSINYHDNGNIRSYVPFIDSRRHGIEKRYSSSETFTKHYYEHGKYHGRLKK